MCRPGVETRPIHHNPERVESSIKFLFCDHSPENIGNIVQALIDSDGDVIAIEKIREGSFGTGTAKEKAELSSKMSSFLDPNNTTAQTAAEYLGVNEPLFTALLDKLKGSGKIMIIIDMGTDNPGYEHYNKFTQARAAYFNSVSPNYENELLDLDLLNAQAYEQREMVMGEQLQQIAARYPGLKITVMLGAMHTPVYHRLQNTHRATRSFVPNPEEAKYYPRGIKMLYGERGARVRTLRFNLEKFGLSVTNN